MKLVEVSARQNKAGIRCVPCGCAATLFRERDGMAKIESKNKEWGFYGTWSRSDPVKQHSADQAWDAAVEAYINHRRGRTRAMARKYLDSTKGRHYAEAVIDSILTDGDSLDDAVMYKRHTSKGERIARAKDKKDREELRADLSRHIEGLEGIKSSGNTEAEKNRRESTDALLGQYRAALKRLDDGERMTLPPKEPADSEKYKEALKKLGLDAGDHTKAKEHKSNSSLAAKPATDANVRGA